MDGDIPLINTNFPVVTIQLTRYYNQVLIYYQVQVNNDFGFLLNGVMATLNFINPISTSCSGIFCDPQRVDDWHCKDRGCGFYDMYNHGSNVTFQHDIKVSVPNGFFRDE